MVAVITDAVIVALLIGGIVYAHMVNRRVKRLVAVLHELEPAVREFSRAVDKSEASVSQMQRSLTEASSDRATARTAQKADGTAENALFSSRRVADVRDMGVKVMRDKQDLVRQFFDATRTREKA